MDLESDEVRKNSVLENSHSFNSDDVFHSSSITPDYYFWSLDLTMVVSICCDYYYDGNAIDHCSNAIYRKVNDEQMVPLPSPSPVSVNLVVINIDFNVVSYVSNVSLNDEPNSTAIIYLRVW